MTAEIAILNRSAVALAADSLATIEREGRAKTYNVNKLFTLSKYHPVGVMVYGNAELIGVPWETIIKLYRRFLGDKSFDTVSEYADDFVSWLGSRKGLFPENRQEVHFFMTVVAYFSQRIKRDIDDEVKRETDEKGAIPETHVNRIAKQVIRKHHRELRSFGLLGYLPDGFPEHIASKYEAEIAEARKHVFKHFSLTAVVVRQLNEIATGIFSRDYWPSSGMSGVVVAGFGDAETFPVIKSFSAHRIILNQLIYRDDTEMSTNLNQADVLSPAVVSPFAQRDVVDAFLVGIDPHFRTVIQRYFSLLMQQWPEILASNVPGMDDESKQHLRDRLNKVSDEILTRFVASVDNHLQEKHIGPLLHVVSVLPIDELAAMAEALVNLTSVKRKMSPDIETVGGPIDVAVISKGDGFVWINRKHYFDKDLNPQFFVNYLKR